MAAINLLPGFGGAYTTTFTSVSSSSISTDTVDCSKAYTLAFVLGPNAGTPSVQLQQSFDNTTWVNIATAVTLASGGVQAIFPATSGPFGLIRFRYTVAIGVCTATLVGFPLPHSW
jgi:hypothetical protein